MRSSMLSLRPSLRREGAHNSGVIPTSGNSNNSIWCCCWAQSQLVTGSIDGTVKVWAFEADENSTEGASVANKIVETFCSPPEMTGCSSIAAARDGSVIIGCFQDSTIRIYDPTQTAEKGKSVVATIDAGLFQASAVSLSPADDVLVAGTNSGGINIWSMQEGHELLTTLSTQNKQIMSTSFSMDGKLTCSGIEGLVNIFDMSSQQLIHTLDAHALPIRTVAFAPDGDLLYTASDDRHVKVFDIRSGSLINAFSHAGMALSVDASPDKRHFAVGCADFTVSLWDLGMQKRIDRAETHSDHVWAVSYDSSHLLGSRFASVGDDGLIQIYD